MTPPLTSVADTCTSADQAAVPVFSRRYQMVSVPPPPLVPTRYARSIQPFS
jgi:hypothetical protein